MTFALALLTIGVLWLALGVRRIGHVSQGPHIEQRPGTALLLIDLQTVFWRDGPYDTATKARAEQAIKAEVDTARQSGDPVIALRQEWTYPSTRLIARLAMKGQAIAGTPGTELASPFAGLPDHVLTKHVQDGFETGELDTLLARLNIGTLRIVGLDGAYCVAKTSLAALARGFEVTLIDDAILTAKPTQFDALRPKLTAQGATFT